MNTFAESILNTETSLLVGTLRQAVKPILAQCPHISQADINRLVAWKAYQEHGTPDEATVLLCNLVSAVLDTIDEAAFGNTETELDGKPVFALPVAPTPWVDYSTLDLDTARGDNPMVASLVD